MTRKHNPGSDEAMALGCICSPEINHNGYGYYGLKGYFCYESACPYHRPKDILPIHMVHPTGTPHYNPTPEEIEEAKRFFKEG